VVKKESVLEKELRLDSHTKNLSLIREEVEAMAAACGFDENELYQLKVAVSEAAANAIEHGSPQGEQSHIKVSITCDSERISIEVIDEGVFKARLPVTDGRPSHRGRGIFLMTALMDEVNITEGLTGTKVRLVKVKNKAMLDVAEPSTA